MPAPSILASAVSIVLPALVALAVQASTAMTAPAPPAVTIRGPVEVTPAPQTPVPGSAAIGRMSLDIEPGGTHVYQLTDARPVAAGLR